MSGDPVRAAARQAVAERQTAGEAPPWFMPTAHLGEAVVDRLEAGDLDEAQPPIKVLSSFIREFLEDYAFSPDVTLAGLDALLRKHGISARSRWALCLVAEMVAEILRQGVRELQTAEAGRLGACTDAGNGARFVQDNFANARYCEALKGGWFVWDGCRWKPDATGEAMAMARQTAIGLAAEAADLFSAGELDNNEYQKRLKWAVSSLSDRSLNAMLAQASQGTELAVEAPVFDARPELLNLRNGTLNLETMEFRGHSREDMLTKVANVDFDERATCPRWEKFIAGVTEGDQEKAGFLQRELGYCLGGTQRHQCFFVHHGKPGCGKSTLMHVVRRIWGDYAATAARGLFTGKSRFHRPDGNQATPGFVNLVGTRVVFVVEMEEGDKFDSHNVKPVTGGDPMTIRQLYRPTFTDQPQYKLIFSLNPVPGLDDFSGAMEDRLRLVGFDRVFRGTRDEIKDLKLKLEGEASGILNWALAGWRQVKEADSLREPAAMKAAIKKYVKDENLVAQWLEEQVERTSSPEPKDWVEVGDAFHSFRAFAAKRGNSWVTHQWFGKRMAGLGHRSEAPNGRRCYPGLALRVSPKVSAQIDF